jgi:diaminopimelate epimerase
MVYYNADGNESSMCGNGGRCLVAFAKQIGVITNETTFIAIDGEHYASVDKSGNVALQMIDVKTVKVSPEFVFLNTGSPHHVQEVDNLTTLDIKNRGASIRYSELYQPNGTNVNFVSPIATDTFAVRTYERGVEDETLSCGTGVTAVAIAMKKTGKTQSDQIKLQTEGGLLEVHFTEKEGEFTNIFLKGPATLVFKGIVDVNP